MTSLRRHGRAGARLVHAVASVRGLALIATILTVASGCDKAKSFVRAGQAARPPKVDPSKVLDLASRPTILFQVFGERSDPRLIPVGAMKDGHLTNIELTRDGWHQLDAMYLRRDARYTVYKDGEAHGAVTVTRGMWDNADTPLYTLPGCQTLTPLAQVKLDTDLPTQFTVEFLAASAPMGRQAERLQLPPELVRKLAHELGGIAGKRVGITPALLDSLDLHAVAIGTGTSAAPTVVASFIDPAAANPTSTTERTAHVLVIAEREPDGTYRPAFTHVVHGPLANAEFRRYVDHLDIDGDGVDEIFLEGWRFRGDTFLIALRYEGDTWREVFRSRSNWCLDERGD
ncbi:MAG TPA: hypothetical protein VFK13_03280 [Gemmatimonadaceae bacterium]|nr:hypothetical protein [Gemmatimonadaceae bacterium]